MSKQLQGTEVTVQQVREYLDLMDPHHTVNNHEIELVFMAIEGIEKENESLVNRAFYRQGSK